MSEVTSRRMNWLCLGIGMLIATITGLTGGVDGIVPFVAGLTAGGFITLWAIL